MKKQEDERLGLFDIMGPVMIGPSSSHTAGAARLGRLVRQLTGGEIRKVTMYLHGSFATTYRGHGTDKALLAGILDLLPSDERLRDSFRLADEAGINTLLFRPISGKTIIRTPSNLSSKPLLVPPIR